MNLQNLTIWIAGLLSEPYHALRRLLVLHRNRAIRNRVRVSNGPTYRNLWSDTQ